MYVSAQRNKGLRFNATGRSGFLCGSAHTRQIYLLRVKDLCRAARYGPGTDSTKPHFVRKTFRKHFFLKFWINFHTKTTNVNFVWRLLYKSILKPFKATVTNSISAILGCFIRNFWPKRFHQIGSIPGTSARLANNTPMHILPWLRQQATHTKT
jgi:hypothetical protein